jgi:hypothetical protein
MFEPECHKPTSRLFHCTRSSANRYNISHNDHAHNRILRPEGVLGQESGHPLLLVLRLVLAGNKSKCSNRARVNENERGLMLVLYCTVLYL